MRDLHDGMIELFAESEHALARELAAVRNLYHLALEQLHQRGRHLDRLREQHGQLRGEYRRLRASILRGDRRAACR
jgi:hypothetical protein